MGQVQQNSKLKARNTPEAESLFMQMLVTSQSIAQLLGLCGAQVPYWGMENWSPGLSRSSAGFFLAFFRKKAHDVRVPGR